jgi:hypothetical protein
VAVVECSSSTGVVQCSLCVVAGHNVPALPWPGTLGTGDSSSSPVHPAGSACKVACGVQLALATPRLIQGWSCQTSLSRFAHSYGTLAGVLSWAGDQGGQAIPTHQQHGLLSPPYSAGVGAQFAKWGPEQDWLLSQKHSGEGGGLGV